MRRWWMFAGTAAGLLLGAVTAEARGFWFFSSLHPHSAPRGRVTLQAPPNPDSVRRDSLHVVRRDSAFVDSTSRDSLKHPHPTPPPHRRPQPQRPRPRDVNYG